MRNLTPQFRALVGGCALALGAAHTVFAATIFNLASAYVGPPAGTSFSPEVFELTPTNVAEGLRINGFVGPLPGDHFADFHVTLSGTMDGPIRPGDKFRVWYAFRAVCSTGQGVIRSFDVAGVVRTSPAGPIIDDTYGSHPATPIDLEPGALCEGSFDLEPFDIAGNTGEWWMDLGVEWVGAVTAEDDFEFRLEPAGLRVQLIRGTPCPGDTNSDRVVDFIDLNRTLSEYGETAFPGELFGDLDDNGTVDFIDLNLVLSYYGRRCS